MEHIMVKSVQEREGQRGTWLLVTDAEGGTYSCWQPNLFPLFAAGRRLALDVQVSKDGQWRNVRDAQPDSSFDPTPATTRQAPATTRNDYINRMSALKTAADQFPPLPGDASPDDIGNRAGQVAMLARYFLDFILDEPPAF